MDALPETYYALRKEIIVAQAAFEALLIENLRFKSFMLLGEMAYYLNRGWIKDGLPDLGDMGDLGDAEVGGDVDATADTGDVGTIGAGEPGSGYNPNEPRIPAGNPDGGQWTTGGPHNETPNSDPLHSIDGNFDSPLESWGRPQTLLEHFERHGDDFSATSLEDYANQANDFFKTAREESFPGLIDRDGNIKFYNEGPNIFGSYNSDGTTRTFFKPDDGKAYFETETRKTLSGGGRTINSETDGGGRAVPGFGKPEDIFHPNPLARDLDE